MIKISVKGETEFGLPAHYEEIEIESPSLDSVMNHYGINEKIRKHLLPVINHKLSKFDATLNEGDEVLLQSPYSGG